jgi:hypothetical protein
VQFTMAKSSNLRTQYPGEVIYWSVKFKEVLAAIQSGADAAAILRVIIQLVCDHLHNAEHSRRAV